MAVFPTLDFAQINARYPKAVKKVTDWIFNQPELLSVTEEFVDPANPNESKAQFAGLMIQMDPRKLYDIFDQFEIYISVQSGVESMGDNKALGWLYKVNKGLDKAKGHYAKTRHEAEVSAFHDAFELFEKQDNE